MLNTKIWCCFFACFLIVLLSTLPASAQSGATTLVTSVLDKAMDIQTSPALQGNEHRKERAELIRKLIPENFMTEEMAKDSLKDHWGKLSAGQRQQYLPLFTAIFVDSYTRRVLDFLKRENIEYPGEIAEGKDVKVRTVLLRPNEHIPVDYIVRQTGHKSKIKDVIIDGVSTVETYQNAFDRFLSAKPFNELIQSMSIQIKAGTTY